MKTVLLCATYTKNLSYFDDWSDAFRACPELDLEVINVLGGEFSLKETSKKIGQAELTIIHHSMNGDTLKHLTPLNSALKERKGKLVSFVGNEVNLPTIGMAPKIANLKEVQPDIIATQLLLEAGEWIYADCTDSKVISLPHALNPKAFAPKKDLSSRPIDIGVRSARYGAIIGDTDRNDIIDFFHKHSTQYGLNVDLGIPDSPDKRFDRTGWANFLNECKATLATEAGTFYLEKDDAIVHEVNDYIRKTHNRLIIPHDNPLISVLRKLLPRPVGQFIRNAANNFFIESHRTDDLLETDDVLEKFFKNRKHCPAYSKAISSRHFDAIGAETFLIMFPGRYGDILKPGANYFELQRDYSNIEELLDLLRDTDQIEKVTKSTREYILENHTYTHRVKELLRSL